MNEFLICAYKHYLFENTGFMKMKEAKDQVQEELHLKYFFINERNIEVNSNNDIQIDR